MGKSAATLAIWLCPGPALPPSKLSPRARPRRPACYHPQDRLGDYSVQSFTRSSYQNLQPNPRDRMSILPQGHRQGLQPQASAHPPPRPAGTISPRPPCRRMLFSHTCAPYGFTSAPSLTESKNIKPGPSVGQLMNTDVPWISEATASQSKLLEAAPAVRFPPPAPPPLQPQEPSHQNNPSSGRGWLLPATDRGASRGRTHKEP